MTIKERLSYYNKLIRRKEVWACCQVKRKCVWLGNKNAGFYVVPELLSSLSIVYSFGVGEDISFDEELIKRFGCSVFAFDPTPKSIDFIRSKGVITNFTFYPVGISNYDGFTDFFLPANPNHVSCTVFRTNSNAAEQQKISVPVKRFSTIANELKHGAIDLLKMDIEGSEYDVIDDILSSGVKIKMLAVELHHRFEQTGINKTKNLLAKLNKHGYKIAAISGTREEYTFVQLKEEEVVSSQTPRNDN